MTVAKQKWGTRKEPDNLLLLKIYLITIGTEVNLLTSCSSCNPLFCCLIISISVSYRKISFK